MIEPVVSATIASLKVLRDKPGVYLKQLDDTLHKLSTEFDLQVTSNFKQQFQQNVREVYIDKPVANLESRFAESDLLSALVTIFHPGNAAKSTPSSFESYGDSAVDTVATKFTTTVVKERLQLEWMGFKHNNII